MLNLKYKDCKSVCEMYLNQKAGSLASYLQWYLLRNIKKDTKSDITSVVFFEKYINNGAFSISNSFTIRTNNYIQNGVH